MLDLSLAWDGGAPNMEPRPSIRPTDPSFIVTGRDGGAFLQQMRWGFPGQRGPVINFRSEGRSFPKGRCLVPVSGFYEFTGTKAPKSKWLFEPADGGFLGVAGLIRDDRFTLLTMPPGPDLAPYHDRQIVLLPKDKWAAWLGRGEQPSLDALSPGSLRVEQIR